MHFKQYIANQYAWEMYLLMFLLIYLANYYFYNPICITICIENGQYSSYVLQWNTTQKQPMKMQLHIFYDLAQTKTVIRKWLANFLLSLFHIYPALLC